MNLNGLADDIFKHKIGPNDELLHISNEYRAFLDADKDTNNGYHTAVLSHPNSGQDLFLHYLEIITGVFTGSKSIDLAF